MRKYIGTSAGDGAVYYDSYCFRHEILEDAAFKDEETELLSIRYARDAALSDILRTSETLPNGKDGTINEILQASAILLSDDTILEAAKKKIQTEHLSASQAIRSVVTKYAKGMRDSGDEFFISRADDMEDVGRRILEKLVSTEPFYEQPSYDSVVIADELSVSEFLSLDFSKVRGVALAKGSPNSHVAIIAKIKSIPMVVSLGEEFYKDLSQKSVKVLLDGGEGALISTPDEGLVKETFQRNYEGNEYCKRLKSIVDKDNVFINISSEEDFTEDLLARTAGIGLYRTEFLFMRKQAPGQDAQVKAYSKVFERAGNATVTVRTVDFGYDKIPDYFDEEDCNLLRDLRGIGFSLANNILFNTQIEAIKEASKGRNVRILLPMVDNKKQFVKAKEMISAVYEKSGMDVPEIGAMIESLEAFGNCGEIAGVADFISIGTNDLALSAFNTRDYKDHGDELVGYVKKIVDIAREKGIKVTVCGEMASDFSFAEKILKMGADGISVTPSVVRVLV